MLLVEGSSATDFVTDVMDVMKKVEGRKKKVEVILEETIGVILIPIASELILPKSGNGTAVSLGLIWGMETVLPYPRLSFWLCRN